MSDSLDEVDRFLKDAFEPAVPIGEASIAPRVLARLERLERFERLRRRALIGMSLLGVCFLFGLSPIVSRVLLKMAELAPSVTPVLDPVLLGACAGLAMSAFAFLLGRRTI